MKNITKYTLILAVAFVSGLFASCVGDLDVQPIDPDIELPEDKLNSQDAFNQFLAECYLGLAVSSSYGPNGGPHIEGIDGGFGQYMRGFFNLQTLPTDEAHICWNDQTIKEVHSLQYTTSDVFVTAVFSRIFYQISVCNEFIRRAQTTALSDEEFPLKKQYIAEARALRALSYYHAIDLFGNVPFVTEENTVGATAPQQIERPDLYKWLVDEITGENGFRNDLLDKPEYGRAGKDFADMLLAKMYLNCEVFGKNRDGVLDAEIVPSEEYRKCAEVCKGLIERYPSLHNEYQHLFMADNHINNNEIIFAVQADGINTQGYGSTNFIILASAKSGVDSWWEYLGIGDAWGGITVCPEFVDRFDDPTNDKRYLVGDGSQWGENHTKEIVDRSLFDNGYVAFKFRNVNADGSAASATTFVDTDYPIFRAADAYLMLTEAQLRNGGVQADGAAAFNVVRSRAGVSEMTAAGITEQVLLDERAREFYWENMRRQDLIRFGVYTKGYNFAWKGGIQEGQDVAERYNLYPIPATDMNTNSNLKQNPGW